MKPRIPLLFTLSTTCFLLPSTATCTGSLSFVYEDIYAKPYYQVFLWAEPAHQQRLFLPQESIQMKTEFGERFLCSLPHPAPEESILTDAEYQLTEKERLKQGLARGKELLAPIKCIYYTNGWFTYEYCHGRHIRQFHRPPPKLGTHNRAERPPLFEYYLGRNSRSEDAAATSPKTRNNHDRTNKENEIEKTDVVDGEEFAQVGLEDGTIYITFNYNDGTLCDVTGKRRTAKVHFFCNQQQEEHISQISEPSICNYVVSIQTPRLCNDPAFVSRSINPINCYPII